MRRALLHLTLSSLALGGAACDGCGPKPSAGPAGRFISGADDVVVTGQVALVARAQSDWSEIFSVVFTDSQRQQARQELALALGFDPTDEAAIRKAGLDPAGRWAAGWSAERDHWVIAVPALDADRVVDAVVDFSRRRFGAEPRTSGGVTRLVSTFGPEEVERAAVAARDDAVLWVLGQDAARVLGAVRAHDLPDSAAALDDRPSSLAMRVDIDGPALSAWLRRARVRDADRLGALAAAWASRFDLFASVSEDGLDLDGAFALTADGEQALIDARPAPGAGLAAVRAVAVPDAILAVAGAIDPEMLFETLLPPESEARVALDEARSEGRLLVDPEREVLPALSGAFAASAGAGDLSGLEFRELVGAPQQALWTAIAVGRRAESGADPYSTLLEAAQASEEVEVESRRLADTTIHAFRGRGTLLTEAAQLADAWILSNEPAVMNRILSSTPSDARPPPLLEIEARFPELARVLKTFRAASLPLFVRATWAQILDAVGLLGDATFRASADGDRLSTRLTLRLQSPEKAETANP